MSGDLDSITLGQLKAMVGSAPRPKQSYYDFRYDDEDTVLNEIEEFYSFVETPQIDENWKAWQSGSFTGEWIKAPASKKKAHVLMLLEGLEHKTVEVRFVNARRLFYLLQGSFAETTSPEHQLHWIFENSKIVRSANGLGLIMEAMRNASQKYEYLTTVGDSEVARTRLPPEEKEVFVEELITEISVYLGMLYHLIEALKGYEDFADELMSLDPPLPVYFYTLVSAIRERGTKGYPTKKLLLVLWKSILCCLGGVRDLGRVKRLARELSGLPPIPDEAVAIKSSPLDIETFHQEISIKYPTFSNPVPAPTLPPLSVNSNPTSRFSSPSSTSVSSSFSNIHSPRPITSVPTNKLAEAYTPIPVRHHYHHDDPDPSSMSGGISLSHFQQMQLQQQQQQSNGGGFRGLPQPGTPAPSPPPPPSPKPKKQQYQTDPTRPFLFPFSRKRVRGRDIPLVPFAIEEADRLYNRHMYVSTSLWQIWKTREECITAESGLDHLRPDGENQTQEQAQAQASARKSIQIDDDLNAEVDALPDVSLLDAKIAEADAAMKAAETGNEKRLAKQRKEDLTRLKRVEQIYGAILPILSNWTLVALKLLLAIVTAASPNQPPSAGAGGFPPGVPSPQEQPNSMHPPSMEDLDVARHREVITKAVSAMLLLTLKWLKVSHVMKFHYLGQQLLDSNCLLLVMKMFGMQDMSMVVVSKVDIPELDFFRYCLVNFSKNPQAARVEENMIQPRRTITRSRTLPNGMKTEEEIDMLTDFSWRNFFSSINFVKILQKLSKHRAHRIRMLVQYKSTAVLKRMLKVQHPMLQLQILKLIKSQVPFSGRKWRQTNMQVITSIYLQCRPDLRDEWLTGSEADDVPEGQAQEQALRQLTKFYNSSRYGQQVAQIQSHAHRRSASMSHNMDGLHPGPEVSGLLRPVGTPNIVEADVFPPVRAQAPDPHIFLPYITEDIAFEEEYEEYLSDLGWSDSDSHSGEGGAHGGTSAWHRLPEFASEIADGISDSESIVSIGDLGDEGEIRESSRSERDEPDENRNNWEHMSPKTMAVLTKSPAGRGARRASSGERLRPVIPFGLDEINLGGDLEDVEDDGEEDLGPMPRDESGPFGSGGGIDEVEYAYRV